MESNDSLYRTVSLIRYVEQKIFDVYMSDVMQCLVHLSIGQESVAAALCGHLTPADRKIGTHRGHALYVANGGDLVAFFGELLGRRCGCSGGRGGSMHLIDLANGLVGTSSIVGGALPIAVGLAMAVSAGEVATVLFGEGAADQGIFAESLNFAQLRRLPVIFACENNRYSVYTPEGLRRAAHPAAVARAFGMTTLEFPIEVGNDVYALHEALSGPIAAVRGGGGPLLFECQTVRRYDHNGVRDDVAAGFRDSAEADLFEACCPMKLGRRHLDAAKADRIDAENVAVVEAAYEQALTGAATELEYQHLPQAQSPRAVSQGRVG